MVFDPSSGFYVSDGRLEAGGGEIRAVITFYLKAGDDWAVELEVRDPGVDTKALLRDASAILIQLADEEHAENLVDREHLSDPSE